MNTESSGCSGKHGCQAGGCAAHAGDGAGKARCDLHVHSKYSDRPSEWFLRRIGAPESFMEPAAIYRRCREAGMDYVTIADHNCIRGARGDRGRPFRLCVCRPGLEREES